MKKIAIIGAGISGLTLAQRLKGKCDIHIFEKSRGVGGRMSLRRGDPYTFDHGAQYFTARTKEFQNFIQPMIDQGVVARWQALAASIDGETITAIKKWSEDEPRYVGVPGMNAVAKSLATELDIQLNTRISRLVKESKWTLDDEAGGSHRDYDWVIFTIPAHQTAELIPAGFKYTDLINSVEMLPCFSLMIGLTAPPPISYQAAFISNSDLSWLAVNSHKPGRETNHTSLLVHSSAQYAQEHINHDRNDVMEHLCQITSRLVGSDCKKAESKSLHLWRYARNLKSENLPVLIDPAMNIAVCGDWCHGGRVEGGFTSAVSLYEQLNF